MVKETIETAIKIGLEGSDAAVRELDKISKKLKNVGTMPSKNETDVALRKNIANLKEQAKHLFNNTQFSVQGQQKIRRSMSLTARQKVGNDYVMATTGTWRNYGPAKRRFITSSRVSEVKRKSLGNKQTLEDKAKTEQVKKDLADTRLKRQFAPKLSSTDINENDTGKIIRKTQEWKKVTVAQAEVLRKEGVEIRGTGDSLEALKTTVSNTTKNLPRFKTEMLNIMFATQNLNRSFAGLMSSGLQLTGMFEVMPMIIGATMLPTMLPLSQAVTNLGLGFLDLGSGTQFAIGSLVAFGYVATKFLNFYSQIEMMRSGWNKFIQDFKGGIRFIGRGISKAVTFPYKALKLLYSGFNKLFKSKKAMTGMLGMWGAMGKAAKSLAASALVLGSALLAGIGTPMGLITVTILSLVAIWWWFGDEIGRSMEDANKKFNESSPRLGDKVLGFFDTIKNYVANLGLGTAFSNTLTLVGNTIDTEGPKLLDKFKAILPDWMLNPTDTFGKVTTAIVTWLKELPGKFTSLVNDVKNAFLSLFPTAEDLKKQFGIFYGFVSGVVSKISNAISGTRTPGSASETEVRGTQSLVNEYKLRNPGKTKEDYFKQYPNDAWIKDRIAGGFLSSPYTTKSGVVYEGIHSRKGLYDMNAGNVNNVTYSPVINIDATINNDVDLRRMADRLDVMMQERMRKYVRGS